MHVTSKLLFHFCIRLIKKLTSITCNLQGDFENYIFSDLSISPMGIYMQRYIFAYKDIQTYFVYFLKTMIAKFKEGKKAQIRFLLDSSKVIICTILEKSTVINHKINSTQKH